MRLFELRGPVLAADDRQVVRLGNKVFDALCDILRQREHAVGGVDPDLGLTAVGLARHKKQTTITSQQLAQRLGIDLPDFKVAIFDANSGLTRGVTTPTYIVLFGSVWDIMHEPRQRSTFIHEFRHKWDLAHGNLDVGRYADEQKEPDRDKRRKAYVNNPAEFDAHFAQWISPINEFLQILEQPDVDFRTIVQQRSRLLGRDLRDYFKRIMKRSAWTVMGKYRAGLFMFYHDLTKENRKRFRIKLAAIYRDAVQKSEAAMATAR